MELRPHSLTAALLTCWYSEFDKKDEFSPCSSFPVLYPQREHATPTLKLFRREPAITEFDKLFTPYHKSSDGFVRPTGAGLHDLLQSLHPAHGKLIPFRVLSLPLLFALFTLAFTMPPWGFHLDKDKDRLAGSFFNRHAVAPKGSDSL